MVALQVTASGAGFALKWLMEFFGGIGVPAAALLFASTATLAGVRHSPSAADPRGASAGYAHRAQDPRRVGRHLFQSPSAQFRERSARDRASEPHFSGGVQGICRHSFGCGAHVPHLRDCGRREPHQRASVGVLPCFRRPYPLPHSFAQGPVSDDSARGVGVLSHSGGLGHSAPQPHLHHVVARSFGSRADARVQGLDTRCGGGHTAYIQRHAPRRRLDFDAFPRNQRHCARCSADHREGAELRHDHRHHPALHARE